MCAINQLPCCLGGSAIPKLAALPLCRDAQVMQRALDTHDRTLRLLLSRYFGYEVTTEGDSFTMAFHDPIDAVRTAVLVT